MAVHLDEEKGGNISDSRSTSTASEKGALKHADTWLERHRKKQRRTMVVGCVIAWGLVLVIAAIVLVMLWFSKVGPFEEA